ncbi:P22 phage major capsid protein family protein [uncultured Microbacterium sp.]|uniref:P22 phage major capsid protein family protein n=1 Tax=uncultured Microbacterium sp. TaxID=191216 RepID=UPI0026259243|nr:P22 phage major capsid protein family protein [uncultured Microbacterium sp.]
MALTNFIPIVWNSQLLLDFRQIAVAANLVNRQYEGDARSGNTVRVNTAGAVVIKDYKTGLLESAPGVKIPRTTSPDAVTSTKADLLIDQEKSFDFLIDDIDRAQAAGSLGEYTQSAAEGMAEDADKFILAALSTTNTHLTASAITTGDQAFDKIGDIKKTLDKAKVPTGNRVAVINAEYASVLLKSSSRLTSVDQSGSPAGLRDGYIGRLLGIDIYQSENTPNVAKPQVIAWYKPSFSYVSQIEKTEAMRDNNSFSDRLRGLHVYGAKAFRPTGIAAFTAS